MEPDPEAEVDPIALERIELERKLDAGAWLRPGEVALLFDTSRQSVDRWIRSGKISYRRQPAGWRILNPVDVRRELDEYRRERRSGETAEPDSDRGPTDPTPERAEEV